jgi:nickel-dependent lactate racemase
MKVEFPGRQLQFEIPDGNLLGVFRSPDTSVGDRPQEVVAAALRDPIGAPELREIAEGRRNVVILVDDVTRPTPASVILPPLLAELEAAGVPGEACTILVAGGTHRPMTNEELEEKLGPDVSSHLQVRFHSASTADLVDLQDPTRDLHVRVSEIAAGADLLIGTGQILPHAIAGFAGGGKIVAPGICGRETIRTVHWSMRHVPPEKLYWSRDHAVRDVIDRIAARAGLRFLVNVILDRDANISAAVAGDPVLAHRKGCDLARHIRGVSFPQPADIVIADSYPFNFDWWQAIKALPAATRVCRPGGTMIVVAECPEGFAPEYREPLSLGYPPAEEVVRMVDEGRFDGIVGAHMLIGSAALAGDRRITLVTDGLTPDEVAGLGFGRAATVEEALQKALRDLGRDARVAVLPNAAQVIPGFSS